MKLPSLWVPRAWRLSAYVCLALIGCATDVSEPANDPSQAAVQSAALTGDVAQGTAGSGSSARAPVASAATTAPACLPIDIADRRCDGSDDDCDGLIDEDCGFAVRDCPPGTNVIVGTSRSDWLFGTTGRDCILGLGGDDILWGRGGRDVLVGGSGNDLLTGSSAADVLLGESGDDTLNGGGGDDQLDGGDGNDTLSGEEGTDIIHGGACHDQITGSAGRDQLFGDGGSDRVTSTVIDRVDGGEGLDACSGQSCELSGKAARVCTRDRDCSGGRRCVQNSGICALPSQVPFTDSICDGRDEDCDGKTDEEYAAVATKCGVGACAAVGKSSCEHGSVQNRCVPKTPAPSDATCNGIDDDCDGQTDEDYRPVCSADGVTSCVQGQIRVASCNDGNACSTDACAEGVCTHSAGSCNDGNPCTADVCDLQLGCTFRPTSGACDDGNACTSSDRCDTAGGCAGSPIATDDQNPCTDDSCDPVSGPQHRAVAGRVCNDGNACTVDDACNVEGACAPGAARNCSDGAFCNGLELCDSSVGCQPGSAPTLDDGVACTSDRCDEASAQVVHTANPAACDNGLFCDGVERCDVNLDCLSGTAPVLNDGVACTADSCDETNDRVVHAPNAAACDDASFCNGAEVCDVTQGCLPGAAPAIDDGVACTVDRCDDASGTVAHDPSDAACDDHNVCTGVETCDAELGCRPGTPLPIQNDNDPCTLDTCDPVSGQTVHTPDPCDDGSACTYDSCVPSVGCRHVNNSLNCKDGSACTVDDFCSGGTCFGGVARNCDDANECTAESCDMQLDACAYTTVQDGIACNGGSGDCRTGSCVVDCVPSAHPPVTTRVADLHAVVGVPVSFFIAASDQDQNTLSFELVGAALPPGLVLDPSSGEIRGTPLPAALALSGLTQHHVVSVSDGCFRASSNAFAIQVSGVPLPQPFALFDFDDVHISGNTLSSVYGGLTGTITGNVQRGQASKVGQRFNFSTSPAVPGTSVVSGSITVGNFQSPLKTPGNMTVTMQLDGTVTSATPQVYYSCGIPGEASDSSYVFQYGVLADGRLNALHETQDFDNVSTSVQSVSTGPRHIAFVRDATVRTYRSFINGGQDSGSPVAYATNASGFADCVVRIGSNNGTTNFARGSMDEMGIWHTVLDANQMATVAWLYRKGISIERWVNGAVSCEGILAADPSSIDGTYVVQVNGQLQTVFCQMNDD